MLENIDQLIKSLKITCFVSQQATSNNIAFKTTLAFVIERKLQVYTVKIQPAGGLKSCGASSEDHYPF